MIMSSKFTTTLAWSCLVFITYATLSPASLRPGVGGSDEPWSIVLIEHLGAFGLLGFLFSTSYPKKRTFVLTVVFGSAVLLELLQLFAPGRDARIIDAIEKLTGGGLGLLAARWLRDWTKVASRSHSAADDEL